MYFLPLYFQAIHNLSASESGIRNIPLIVTNSLVSCFLGYSIGRVGYVQPFMTASGVLTAIGAGLLYSLDINSSTGAYLGYQAVLGVGLGLGIQAPMIAIQATSAPEDLAAQTAIVLCESTISFLRGPWPQRFLLRYKVNKKPVFQLIGGAIFVSMAENIFSNRLLDSISSLAPSGISPSDVLNAGATGIEKNFSPQDIPAIIASYMIGLKAAWALGVALAATAAVASFGPERRSIAIPKNSAAAM